MSKHSFLSRLRRALPKLHSMHPTESATFAVDANYGHYTVTVGPEYAPEEIRQRHLRPHARPIEVAGEIHHLFLEADHLTALPSREAVDGHLKATVILHDLHVHIFDPNGDGGHILIEPHGDKTLAITKTTNFAGGWGTQRLQKMYKSGTLTHQTYRIIQEDIIKLCRRQQTNGHLRRIS
jgi:hypothetical protein